ncbi:hypothetical protein [Pedococcus soli]
MTDFLESVRPVEPLSLAVPVAQRGGVEEVVGEPDDAATEPSVRELLSELAHLEDLLRAAGPVAVGDDEVLAVMAREQAIIDELHRRNPSRPGGAPAPA